VDSQLFDTQRELNDLAEIVGRIAEDDAEAATRFGTSLLDHLDLLPPFLGWAAFASVPKYASWCTAQSWFTTPCRKLNAVLKYFTCGTERGSLQGF
jgi:hypothetical protein